MLSTSKGKKLGLLAVLLLLVASLLAACGDTPTATTTATTAAATSPATTAATTSKPATTAATTAAVTTVATTVAGTTNSATTAATSVTTAASGAAVAVPGGYKVNTDATISASGASFPNPIYQQWIKDFAAVNPTVKITYNSVGSGAGRKDFFGGNTDFAGTDAYPSEKELTDYGKPVLAIPTTLGAVVLAYNLDGVSELKLSADTIGAIYTGKITKWNDAKIAAENAGVTLPDLAITLAVRQDDSGTTTVFSNWLAEVNKEFADLKIAGGKPAWEKSGITVVQGPQNDGVAGLVKQTKGTLGYIESSYADANKITYAAIKNPGGKYVKATVESISKAAAGGAVPENLKLKVSQSADPEAYPIASTTWILVNKEFANKSKAEAVVKYLWWVTSDAAPIEAGKKLGYAPLPAPVVAAVQAKLLTVTAGGQAVLAK